MRTSLNQAVLERLRAEYLEMPGLRLTVEQVQRLCGIEPAMCRVMLETLVESKFLCAKSNGAYARLTDGDISRPRRLTSNGRRDGNVASLARVSGDST
jgi:hypothetical protein